MDKCREAFEKQKHLTIYISNLVFDEKDNRYIPNEKRIRTFEEWEWKAFSNQAYAVNLAWWAWQSRQAEFDSMTEALLNQTQLLAKQKVEIEEKDKRIESQSNCIENLVVQKSDYLDKVTKAIAHLDSFDHSKASINKLQRSIECALEALRGEHE